MFGSLFGVIFGTAHSILIILSLMKCTTYEYRRNHIILKIIGLFVCYGVHA